MTYHFVTAGTPGQLSYEVLWKGNIGKPIATCDDARDAKRICDALNQLEADSQQPIAFDWIRVEDRMPDDCSEILVYTKEEEIFLAYHEGGRWLSSENDEYICGTQSATHWCDPVPPTSTP